MPRLRNRLAIQGHPITQGTIIELRGTAVIYVKVVNIDQTHIYYSKRPATGREHYGPLHIDTIGDFIGLLEDVSAYYSLRILNAQT